ncbi:hypothetical protein BJ944DRAFT_238935 [Cunninghamella echinulata]|nr:hypothetical protein BJ944DRAFT_238935 [Cunninghamella echinulata]
MNTPTNSLSPSSSFYSQPNNTGSILGKSASNRSLYRDFTSGNNSNANNTTNTSIHTGARKATTGRSRQNTTDFMTGEDLVRTIGADYQDIQKRTLTKWVNSQLEKVDDRIQNIETDFKDGRKLLKLLSVVSNIPTPKPEKMNMRIHQLANVAQALSFLEKQLGADSIIDMGNEAIVNGDKKKTLALIFFIMLKYQIQIVLNEHGDDFNQSLLEYSDRHRDGLVMDAITSTTQETTAAGNSLGNNDNIKNTPSLNHHSALQSTKKIGSNYSIASDKQQHTSSASESKLALLFWVRIQLEDYIVANVIPNIQDFSRSWRNGVAFCLLLHRHNANIIPDLFSHHLKEADLSQKQTWHRLLTLAFDLATEHMHIPRYLEPEDLVDVDYPPEPCVMMYVAEFYKVMSKLQKELTNESRQETALRRRANIAMVYGSPEDNYNDEHDTLSPTSPTSCVSPPLSFTIDENDSTAMTSTAVTTDDDNGSTTSNTTTDHKMKNRKKMHRLSSLADEDKERIKADLNSRLMMQLTGHLPRGIHPLLDKLITIHETVLSFIKTNTRTLDEIPTSFDDADTVAEYLDALDIIEEQMKEESSLLESAEEAKNKLISPPEAIDDESMIRLTDLQRTQVGNLYDMLKNHWVGFEDLLSTTKTDLLRIETELVNIEDGTMKYHSEADKVMDRITELLSLLDKVIPKHEKDEDEDKEVDENNQHENENEEGKNQVARKIKKGDVWHPLDSDDLELVKQIADTFSASAQNLNEQVEIFDNSTWKQYRRFILQFSRAVLKQVSTKMDQLEKGHQQVMDTNHATLTSSKNFGRALEFISATTAIGLELESIHKLMDDTNHTTDDAILDLEKQVTNVRTSIHNTRELYDDLLIDPKLTSCMEKVQQQYEMVRDWVDQVRVWFIEAERIRKWIEVRLDIIEQRNQSVVFDPLSDELPDYVQENASLWFDEHDKLGREIDRFNADDMTRLRTHVKTLAGTERGDRDLSPADTSTIEITLTTLNMLNQLMLLLRQRSNLVNMLMLRVQWDDLFTRSNQWILDTNHQLHTFSQAGQARWIPDEEDIVMDLIDSTSTNSSGSGGRHRRPATSQKNNNRIDTEDMIQTLVALETQVINFDQTLYSECLDAYQEMEDLHNGTLPAHLDSRQTELEETFSDVMKRSGYLRKVVEQHLSLLDITKQYKQLRDKGEALHQSMANPSTSTRNNNSHSHEDGDDDDIYSEQVQAFKEESSQLVLNVFSRVVYTEAPHYSSLMLASQDLIENEQGNDAIREAIQSYGMKLATIAESLENLLANHRMALSLQQRATLAYEEMVRLTQWFDERCQLYNENWLDKLMDNFDISKSNSKSSNQNNDYNHQHGGDEDSENESDLDALLSRYQRELDSTSTRMKQIEEGDLSRLRHRVAMIEEEIDASNAISIDRSTLINAIERLDESHLQLQHLLDQRSWELTILRKRQVWENELMDVNDKLNHTANNIWKCIETILLEMSSDNYQQQHIKEAKKDDKDLFIKEIKMSSEQLQSELTSIDQLSIFLPNNGCFTEFVQAYKKNRSTLPSELETKQHSLIDKRKDLDSLYTYISTLLDYKSTIDQLIQRTYDIQQHGAHLKTEFDKLFGDLVILKQQQQLQDTVDTDDVDFDKKISHGTELLALFKKDLDQIVQFYNNIDNPTNKSTLFTSLQNSSVANDGNTFEQINKWFNTKHNELQTLFTNLSNIQTNYLNITKIISQANKIKNEAKTQQDWINKHLGMLKERHLDLSDVTLIINDELITEREQYLNQTSNDITTYHNAHIVELKNQLSNIHTSVSFDNNSINDNNSLDILGTYKLDLLMNQIDTGMKQLEQQVTSEHDNLLLTQQYLECDKELKDSHQQLDTVHDQLNLLISHIKDSAKKDDLSTLSFEQLEKPLASIKNQTAIVENTAVNARQQVNDLSSSIQQKLSLSSSSNTICDHLNNQLGRLDRTLKRLQESFIIKKRDIDTLKEQQIWQQKAKNVLKNLQNQSIDVNRFIDDKARWKSGTVMMENEEMELRSAWATMKSNLEKSRDQCIQPLVNELQNWIDKKLSNHSSSGDDVHNNGLSEWTMSLIGQLDHAKERVEANLTFANEIINQRSLMAAFIWRTSQLEHSAEVIKEEFLDKKQTGTEDDSAHLLEDHKDRLERFNSGIDDIRQGLATTIPLPVRSQITSSLNSEVSLSSSDSTPTSPSSANLEDETTNAIIKDTISTRLALLQELSDGLQSILNSKVQMTRREMAKLLCEKQVEACETWLKTNQEKLKVALETTLLNTDDNNNNNDNEENDTALRKLREHIGISESIEAATHGKDTVLTSLTTAFKAYDAVFEDKKENDLTDEYERLQQLWESLKKDAIHTKTTLLARLGPAEINRHIKQLKTSIHNLQKEIDGMTASQLTDDHISQWQKQIDTIDKNDYTRIVKMITTSTSLSPSSSLDKQQEQLDDLGEIILQLRNTLTRLYDVVNLNRLCKTYGENAEIVQSNIDDTQQIVIQIQQSHKKIKDVASVNDYQQVLLTDYQNGKEKLNECKEAYDDLCSYGKLIEIERKNSDIEDNDFLTEMLATQEKVNNQWKALQINEQSVASMVTQASRWVQCSQLLKKIEDEVTKLQEDLSNKSSSTTTNGSTTTSSTTTNSPPINEKGQQHLNMIEKQIQENIDNVMLQVDDLLNLSKEEDENKIIFVEYHDQVYTKVQHLHVLLDQQKKQSERNKLIKLLNEEVARLRSVCEEQLRFIRQQALANPELVGKRSESVNHILQTYSAVMTAIGKVCEKCKEDYNGVLTQGKRLIDYYHMPPTQWDSIKRPLEKIIQDFSTSYQTEEEYISALRLVVKHAKMEADLTRSLSDMKATLLKYSKQGLRSRIHSLPDKAEFTKRNEDLCKSVENFFALGDDFKKSKLYKSIGVARTSTVNKAIDHHQDIVRRMWSDIKLMMGETKLRLDEMYKRQNGVNKLNETLRYVDDFKERINSIQLSGKSVTVESDELKVLDEEIKVTLAKKIADVDILLASLSDSDGVLRKQRAHLSTVTDELHHLMQVRCEQAKTEGNITLFLGIIDQVDELLVQLQVVIEKTAPHNAKVVGDKFDKSDLQGLLRRLITTYKENGPKINKLLASAKEEARKQFLDDNDRVAKRLEKTLEKWSKAQIAASAREKELQTCINALNHEFFTKLAMAKKKTKTPTTPSSPPPTKTSRRSSFVAGITSPSPTRPITPNSPNMKYISNRRTSFQASSLTVDRMSPNLRRSKTPNLSSSKPRSTYISDPKNELDVQLGRIVNNSAFRMSIKMVPNQVGKYWFGDRLVYCRILPSKMVMVRVGGGWVELSQFMKDHHHVETSTTRSVSSMDDQDNNSVSSLTRSVSPSGKVTIRGGGSVSSSSLNPNHSISKTSSRSKSPVPSGYMDGDTFVHVNEDGHQVVTKMTKAKEDAKTPIKRHT